MSTPNQPDHAIRKAAALIRCLQSPRLIGRPSPSPAALRETKGQEERTLIELACAEAASGRRRQQGQRVRRTSLRQATPPARLAKLGSPCRRRCLSREMSGPSSDTRGYSRGFTASKGRALKISLHPSWTHNVQQSPTPVRQYEYTEILKALSSATWITCDAIILNVGPRLWARAWRPAQRRLQPGLCRHKNKGLSLSQG